MTLEFLVTLILAVCPPTQGINTTECHLQINNCAVGKGGKIEEARIKECIKRYDEQRSESNKIR